MSLVELQAKMAAAIAANDVKAIESIAGEIVKGKSDRHRAEVEVLQKEAEALAGVRQELAEKIRKAIDKAIPDLADQLTTVKTSSFRYTAKGAKDSTGLEQVKSSVGLDVPVIKAHKAGAGATGKTKTEFGVSLNEVFEKFATPADKAKLAGASNSRQWQVKVAVKKRALAAGLLAPVK